MNDAGHDVSILPFDGIMPDIHPTAFIAPGCRVIGRVTIGAHASVWYNCVLRGDVNDIHVGERTNIQDGTVIHCDSPKGDHPGTKTIIGNDCLIGHMAMLHGCTLQDFAFVGIGSIVMDNCMIETDGMLAAGALLTPGKRLGGRQLWTGRPAKPLRDLSEAEIASNRSGTAHYVETARLHAATLRAEQGAR